LPAATTVCAVVISYHPDEYVFGNLSLLRRQIDNVIVVDNGSLSGEVEALRRLAGELGLTLIENADNLGIATALNQGVDAARGMQADWVFLFDQDSRVTPGFADAMLNGFYATAFGRRVGILNPRYIDSRFNTDLPQHRYLPSGELESATTSGSLSPMGIYDELGPFADELFIDGVDYEISLRARSRGYVCATCQEAVLLHAPGTPRRVSLAGFRFTVANYSHVRRYFQERNKVWCAKRYFRRFPGFFYLQFFISFKDLMKVILGEENKGIKVRAFLRGTMDGVRNRMGPYCP
jgi:rhamnosyltransferase